MTIITGISFFMTKTKAFIYNCYLVFFVIGCMTFYVPGQQFYGPQEAFFQFGAMMFLGLSYFVPDKRKITNLFLGLIFVYAVLNTVFMHSSPINKTILLNLFFAFFFIHEVARKEINFKLMGNALALFCALNVVWLALQIHNIDPVFASVAPNNMPQVDTVGWVGLKSNLGTLAALSFPFIFYTSPFSCIVLLPLLWFAHSSAAVLAISLTALFMAWHKSKRLFLGLLGVLLGASLFYVLKVDMPDGEFMKRFPVWFAGIKILAGSSPWFGQGLGAWAQTRFSTLQLNGEPQVWVWAHNEFLQYFFELGLAGLALLILYFRNLAKRLDFSNQNHIFAVSMLIPLVVVSSMHFPFHIARFAGLGCFMLASIEALLSEKR